MDWNLVQLYSQVIRTYRSQARCYRKAGYVKLARQCELKARGYETTIRDYATESEFAA